MGKVMTSGLNCSLSSWSMRTELGFYGNTKAAVAAAGQERGRARRRAPGERFCDAVSISVSVFRSSQGIRWMFFGVFSRRIRGRSDEQMAGGWDSP